jgi:hypothetical protein
LIYRLASEDTEIEMESEVARAVLGTLLAFKSRT